MDTQPDLQEHTNGPRYASNGLIFALIIIAVLLGATAGWMRYSKKRACGFQDAAYQGMGAMLPELCPIGGVIPGGAASRFICPQCSSYCWTQVRAGCPLCPICRQPMVPEVTGVAPAAGPTAAAPARADSPGRMGGAGLGPGGLLVCPKCGMTVAHQRGVPCFTVACTSCGTMMTRVR